MTLKKPPTDWKLIWTIFTEDTTLLVMTAFFGILFTGIGLVVLDDRNTPDWLGWLFIGPANLFWVFSWYLVISSIPYQYGQKMLKRHGMHIEGVLTRKVADCSFEQVYDEHKRPQGEGWYECNLLVEYKFEFNGKPYESAFYLSKADLFDKLQEGDQIPLRILPYDPSTTKVRTRRLSNLLKEREPDNPSMIPEGAEISSAY